MSYRVLLLGQLIPLPGQQLTLFQVEKRVVYDAKRAVSVAYADTHYVSNLTCGLQLACL